jgi:WD40 repeat protein
LPASGAQAAFPGKNGKIAFARHDPNEEYQDLFTANPDGSGTSRLTFEGIAGNPAWAPDGVAFAWDDLCCTTSTTTGGAIASDDAIGPAWSPDGTKVVFRAFLDGLVVSNPDGSGRVRLGVFGYDPAWSPDGTQIAFESGNDIYVVDADGTSQTPLVNDPATDSSPNWSPDGSKIAFHSTRDGNTEVYVMDADGSDETRLTNTSGAGELLPAWSPDGKKIAFQRTISFTDEIWIMNADGSGQQQVTNNTSSTFDDFQPDWQPLPINGYPRPKGATPIYVSLVPAYKPCTSPNREHGGPLVVASCNPPAQESAVATVGTLDANGNPAKSLGFADIRVKVGNPATPADEADLNLRVQISDVRKVDLSDYTGELQARPLLRITDKLNSPSPGGPGAATTQDVPFPFAVPCAPTGDTTIGSLCDVVTSADAVLPGTVIEERRSNWQLQRFDVYDDSATLFATQGIFVP